MDIPELVHSPPLNQSCVENAFQGRKQSCFTATKGQLLSDEELKVEKNIRTASGKKHPTSAKSQTLYSRFRKVTTLDVSCFAGAGTATMSLYLPYYKPDMTDTQAGQRDMPL